MKYTQLCCFEITTRCNLATAHPACPNLHPDRYGRLPTETGPLSDEQILDVLVEVHRRGFTGLVGWHFYCEPMFELERILEVQRKGRERIPMIRYLLWTNGTLFPRDLSPLGGAWETIIVSNYLQRDWTYLGEICEDVRVVSGDLDWRIHPPSGAGSSPCLRPYCDLLFDYYGNLRPCCWDWQGETSPGNLHQTELAELLSRWFALRDKLGPGRMADDAPPRCRSCGTRYNLLAPYDQATAERTAEHLRQRGAGG